MGTKSFEAKVLDNSYESFLQRVQSKRPEFISVGKGVSLAADENNSSVPLDKSKPAVSIPEESKSNDGKYKPFELNDENNPFESFLKEADAKPAEPKKENLPKEQAPLPFMTSFLVELVHCIKNSLASIYHTTSLTMEENNDTETKKDSHTQVKQDIQKIDSLLNSLLNFININTPIAKENTLYVILEEILEANEKQLRGKNIKIIKKFEKDLPETYIHNEQVRFILHSVLQYTIFSTPRNETIVFLMKALDFHDGMDTKKDSPEKKRRYVELMVGFDGDGKLTGPLENLLQMPEDQRQPTDLILILANEILTKNRGSMTIESNGKRPKTLITLRFPIERRNVVYYEPITL